MRHLGLSRGRAGDDPAGHAAHPITALQTEYSLWSRDPEDEVLPTVRELGIGFVAYSPLGRGFLTGPIRSPRIYRGRLAAEGRNPRFQGENIQRTSNSSTG